jgi:hypothetical protein
MTVSPGLQIVWLMVMAIPIACISWTVTHEDIFREPREYCAQRSRSASSVFTRKCFYLFTCEYCFSHYVTALFLVITRYRLLYMDWRGYLIAGFALVFVANFYMGVFGKVKLEVRRERVELKQVEQEVKREQNGPGENVRPAA